MDRRLPEEIEPEEWEGLTPPYSRRRPLAPQNDFWNTVPVVRGPMKGTAHEPEEATGEG
jgi:hypothetical protein